MILNALLDLENIISEDSILSYIIKTVIYRIFNKNEKQLMKIILMAKYLCMKFYSYIDTYFIW